MADFPYPVYFAPPLKEFPSELGIGARGLKTNMMELSYRTKSLTIPSAMWIQYTNMMDGHRATAKTARLRVASRGKNHRFVTLTARLQSPIDDFKFAVITTDR